MKCYAGVGSRETPQHIQNLMTDIAVALQDLDYCLRSGGAIGADTAFEAGVNNGNKSIYIPMLPLDNELPEGHIYIGKNHPEYAVAYQSLKFHPRGFSLSPTSKNLMIRNYFQIFGHDNEPPSAFVVCWTPDAADGYDIKTSYDSGGTGQAIRLARSIGIPVYNLANQKFNNMTFDDILIHITSTQIVSQSTSSLF